MGVEHPRVGVERVPGEVGHGVALPPLSCEVDDRLSAGIQQSQVAEGLVAASARLEQLASRLRSKVADRLGDPLPPMA